MMNRNKWDYYHRCAARKRGTPCGQLVWNHEDHF
jgi:hypothetical protein